MHEGTQGTTSPSPPQFPDRSLFHPRYWITWLWLALLWMLTVGPDSLRRFLGQRLGDLNYRLNHKRRLISAVNLNLCFPQLSTEKRREIAKKHFRLLGQCMLDYGLLWFSRSKHLYTHVEIEGEQHVHHCREQGHNTIILVAHTPALDFAAAALGLRYPVIGPYKAARNRLIDRMMARGRLRFVQQVYERNSGMLAYVKAVKRGQMLFFLPDEDLGLEHSVFAPFFGVMKATHALIGRMARLTDAKLIPCICIFDDHKQKYSVQLYPALELSNDDPEKEATQLNQALEDLIRTDPGQYMWTFRLFNTRPQGEAPVYTRS